MCRYSFLENKHQKLLNWMYIKGRLPSHVGLHPSANKDYQTLQGRWFSDSISNCCMCPSRKQPNNHMDLKKSWPKNFKKWPWRTNTAPASSICFILAETCRNPLSPLTFQWSPVCPPHVFHDFCEISAPHRKRCSLAAWSRKYSNRWVQPLDIYQLIWTIDDLGVDNLPAGMQGWNFQPLLLARFLMCVHPLKWQNPPRGTWSLQFQ